SIEHATTNEAIDAGTICISLTNSRQICGASIPHAALSYTLPCQPWSSLTLSQASLCLAAELCTHPRHAFQYPQHVIRQGIPGEISCSVPSPTPQSGQLFLIVRKAYYRISHSPGILRRHAHSSACTPDD